MPDLMTHLIFGLILAELFGIRKKSLVVIGALLPDLIAKMDLVIFYLGIERFISFTLFHTPAMVFLLSILIARLFRYSKFKTVILINLGSLSHFLIDLTMKHFTPVGTRLFFPLTSKNYYVGLIWPEQSIYLLLVSILLYAIIRMYKQSLKNPFRLNIF